MEPGDINRIIPVMAALEQFWRKSHGWAPPSAAQLLAEARLDRQARFAQPLADYLEPFPMDEAEARQIMGSVTLRSIPLCQHHVRHFFSLITEQGEKDSLHEQPFGSDSFPGGFAVGGPEGARA